MTSKAHVAPQNLEAEESVLGAMLLSPGAIGAVSFLEDDDFYRESHGTIYRTILSLNMRGESADAITVVDALEKAKKLKDVGGRARIHELAALVPATANAAHYAKIVRAHCEQRRVLRILAEATLAAQTGDLMAVDDMVQGLSRQDTDGLEIVAMGNALADLEEEIKNPPDIEEIGIDVPFSFLRPQMPGRMSILGGYQGEGKTALMGQYVQVAAHQKKKIGVFTMEMTWRDLRDRFVTSQGVPYEDLQNRRLTSDFARQAYTNALMEMSKWQVEFIDKGDLTIGDIERVQRIQDYDYIVIDHLHQFAWRERRDIELIVHRIVTLAKRANVHILLLAQLKRPFGSDRLPRPTMSMLRETGMIEAEAAMVNFVYRPRNDEGLRHSEAEFIIAKNRFGEEGLHKLFFLGDQVRFLEATL